MYKIVTWECLGHLINPRKYMNWPSMNDIWLGVVVHICILLNVQKAEAGGQLSTGT